jgi:RND family efflux transporter MFP subunit
LSNNIKTLAVSAATLLILLLMILWMAGTFGHKIEPGINDLSAQYSGPTLTVAPERISLFEEVTGSVQSRQSTDIAAQIQALIKSIHVKSGDMIEPGQLLITLDDLSLQARSAQAGATLNAINARLLNAKSHFNRMQNLYAKESATLANLEAAKADYESLKAQLSAAQQALNETRHVAAYSRIKATFPARVIDRYAEPGDIALPGRKLLSVYDPDSLRIEAHVRESVAVALAVGQTLEAQIDALDRTMPVTIEEIVPVTDPGARSVLIKTRAKQQPGLVPGMFARLRIPQGEEQVLLIPRRYLHQVGQLDVVWVVQDGQIVRRFVRLGRSFPADRVKVIAGLNAGENLILPEKVLSAD